MKHIILHPVTTHVAATFVGIAIAIFVFAAGYDAYKEFENSKAKAHCFIILK